LEAARKAKPDETTWDESLDAAAQVTEAAELAGQLADKLHQCIGKAQELSRAQEREDEEKERRDRERKETNRRWIIGIVVSIVIAIATAVGGFVVGQHSDNSSSAASSPQHVNPR